MDSVYSGYEAISSEKINIAEYFDDYHRVISEYSSSKFYNDEDCSVSTFMPSSLEEEELDMLADYCSIDKLKVPGELGKNDEAMRQRTGHWSIETTEIPTDNQLVTLSNLREIYRTQNHENIKSHKRRKGELTIRYDKSKSDGPMAIPGKDPVVYVRVYRPFLAPPASKNYRNVRLSNVIAILGSQTLDKLRDLIECMSELTISKNVSKHVESPNETTVKEIYKSGFFYIEGTFYNDFRNSDNKDNSRVIREWAASRNLGPFTTANMEDTRVDSLSVRFGYPWVYQHQGNCEHLIVFSDARLLVVEDELAISAYPRIHRSKQRRGRFCATCGRGARWVIFDSERIPYDPAYQCNCCFESYNYINGKKVGDFKAYRYPYNSELLKYCTRALLADGKQSS